MKQEQIEQAKQLFMQLEEKSKTFSERVDFAKRSFLIQQKLNEIKKTLSLPHIKICGLFCGFLDAPKSK